MPGSALEIGLGALGGVVDLIGTIGRASTVKSLGERERSFAAGQRQRLKEGTQSISDLIKTSSTYQPDTELYQKAQEAAELQQRVASSQGRVQGEDIAKQQILQNQANAMAQAKLGARSGTDLMTAALLGQNTAGAQQLDIEKQSMLQKQARMDAANQQYMNLLYQTAAETARQKQLAFTSEAQKQQQLISFRQNAFQSELGQEYQLFQDEKRGIGAYADTIGSIYSGVGGVFRGISSGMMAASAQDAKLSALQDILSARSIK
jgi:hypothetical protein